jgi:hypothetical protein
VISIPATIIAALDPGPQGATQLGSIDLVIWALIAPTQAIAAWPDARLGRMLRACDFAGRRGGEDLGGKAGGELTHRAENSGAYAGSALSAIAGEINPAIEVAAELRPQSGIGVIGV